MKIFITGATGYIGNKLALAAAAKGWIVHALVRNPNSRYIPVHPNIFLFKGDISDRPSIIKAMSGCKFVFHCAAYTKETGNADIVFQKINVEGTQNILEAALQTSIERLVFTGSCSVLDSTGNQPISESNTGDVTPTTIYALTKYKAEELVKEYCKKGLPTIIVSPSRIYGPGNLTSGNPITGLIRKTLKNRIAIIPSDRKITGNYVFIDDVVRGHLLAMEKGTEGEKYFLGGENISYENFFSSIRELAGKKILIIPVPKTLAKTATRLYNAVCKQCGRKTNIPLQLIERIWQNRIISSEKAIRRLDYTVTPFNEGLKSTLDFLHQLNDKKMIAGSLQLDPAN